MSLTGTSLIWMSLAIKREAKANTKLYCNSDALHDVEQKIP